MRVMLVNWAPIREGAAQGGGVNGYCQSLALALVRLGHEVVSLSSGTSFKPAPGSRDAGPCHIMRRDDWRSIRIYEVVNSPVLAPSIHQFNDPAGEISAPGLEDCVRSLTARLAPDVVHFHNLEGFSIGCVGAMRSVRDGAGNGDAAPGPAIFFSLHNYHTICPQVNLLRGHRLPCFDYDNGHACVHCVEAPDPAAARRRLVAGKGAFAPMLPLMPHWVRMALWQVPGLKTGARAVKRWAHTRRRAAAFGTPPPEPAPADVPRPTWVPLTNSIEPAPASSRPPNEYARRRGAMIDMLNACDGVLAVSDFVRRKYESMGVSPAVVSTLHIGTRINQIAARLPAAEPPPFRRPDGTARPVRLVFLGFNHYSKGLPMLAEALALLVPEILGRIDLTIHALGAEAIESKFRRLQRRLAGLTLRPGYRFEEVPRLLAGQDLGIVPSVWWDNGPQTVFEFLGCGVPVLGADIGGIPDFVQDGHNGLLFRANDRYDLARRLAAVTAEPDLLTRLRRNVRPPKDIAAHARELAGLYQSALSSSAATRRAAPAMDDAGCVVRARLPRSVEGAEGLA